MRHALHTLLATLCLAIVAQDRHAFGDSLYTTVPDDPAAVYLEPRHGPDSPAAEHDDTERVQAAIDQAAVDRTGGIVFVTSGTYTLTDTVYIWPGVRIIGIGPTRPLFRLPPRTPGFETGEDKYVLFFSGGRGANPGDPPRDGTPGTFYSGMSNVNIEIGEGNHAAAAIRFHVAQHCSLAHMDLDLGDARAGLVDIGNLVERLHITGGEVAIDTARSAPGWPIAILDCTFENQRLAAIRSREAGLAIVRPIIRNTPAAVETEPGFADQLWISDGQFEDISGPAVIISRAASARTQVTLENITCQNVPELALLRDTGERFPGPGNGFVVDRFTHGLHLGRESSPREQTTILNARPTGDRRAPISSDVTPLPPADTWVNVRDLGVVGDGRTDDTAALRAAIASHRVLYFPMGWYNITDTLTLREETVLIGLHPARTIINLPNDTPAFAAPGDPKPLIETQPNAANIITGLGIHTSQRNPRALAVKWQAGPESLLDDVRLHGGHGTFFPGCPYTPKGDPDHWNTQPTSLLVTNGGGGVLKNIWTPNPHARSGLHIKNTTTPGRLYAMSVEHHVDHEVIIENASNWRFFALQFEAEREESARALPMKIESSSNLLFANTFFYRVISSHTPFPHAITVADSTDIRFRNIHLYSNSKVSYDSSVYDTDTGTQVRDPEFAALDLPAAKTPVPPATIPANRITRIADGFQNVGGAATAPNGDVYFADPRENRVYRWSHTTGQVQHVVDIAERPEQLAFDRAGNLLIVAYEGDGTVLAYDPADPASPRKLEATPPQPRPDATPILPSSRWEDASSFPQSATVTPAAHFISPDGSVFITAEERFVTGERSWGVKHTPLLRTFALARATPGRPFYVTNDLDLCTYEFDVEPEGSLTNPRLFAEEGGESVITDSRGNVYIAAGQILVYNPAGERIGAIHTPKRPTSLAFGGPDRRTLVITARDTLYAVRTPQ